MNSLWWLALPLVLLPVWWHRQRREKGLAAPLASAHFLPRADPRQLRRWRWRDHLLLLARCLLLALVIGWLADLVLPWRGDAVLIAPGTDDAWASAQIQSAGLGDAERIRLPDADAFAFLARHEREWQSDARLLVLGDVPMPALAPRLRHRVDLRTRATPASAPVRHVAIVSANPAPWRTLFTALDGPHRYLIDAAPNAGSDLIIWDVPQAPPPQLHAPLWWVGDAAAFPALRSARAVEGLRYADTPRGMAWLVAPPRDADSARALFDTWQRLHYRAPAYTTPSQVIAASAHPPAQPADGAQRYLLTLALMALFAFERIMTHASRG